MCDCAILSTQRTPNGCWPVVFDPCVPERQRSFQPIRDLGARNTGKADECRVCNQIIHPAARLRCNYLKSCQDLLHAPREIGRDIGGAGFHRGNVLTIAQRDPTAGAAAINSENRTG